ncbi:hypothetical protein MCL91_04655 [Providencia rettgeri]|uniref:Uncharacterized protein n=1 Tax=Providencia rettgeri TaxID=587 RepID=A0AAP2K1V3_PRORE|nr:hypothetical protein [Providencia rettgeri]MBX6961123.1 hypothetical protein [Providencia rettgeri]MBX6982708.1 hypothetical protein [Providencia rettgeri]MCG9506800.1 hypothetical protein [Providencia rettgeri]TCG12244.1 hypothetical protein EX224_21895 [Providencia rettgeri]
MKKFIYGFILGSALSASIGAFSAGYFGGTGYIFNWEVTKDGVTICEDPYIWESTREIECD